MKQFITGNPVISYYILVFTISWGGILVLIGGPANVPGPKEQAERLFIPALLIMFAGPFVSGILMNLLVDGRQGLRNLVASLSKWRLSIYWCGLAVCTGPLLVAAVLFGLSLLDQQFLPGVMTAKDVPQLIIFGVSWGLVGGGLFEETGWTGFAVPQLRKRHGILATGLIVGILWGVWHFMIAFWASNYLRGLDSWSLFVAGFVAFYLLALPAYRVLLVLVYDRTGSLPITMIMHAFLSAATLIFQPTATGKIAFIWNSVLGVVLCILVAGIYARRFTTR